MPLELRMKLSKVGNSLRLTIPKPVVDSLHLREGNILILSVSDDDEIIVRKQGGRKR